MRITFKTCPVKKLLTRNRVNKIRCLATCRSKPWLTPHRKNPSPTCPVLFTPASTKTPTSHTRTWPTNSLNRSMHSLEKFTLDKTQMGTQKSWRGYSKSMIVSMQIVMWKSGFRCECGNNRRASSNKNC